MVARISQASRYRGLRPRQDAGAAAVEMALVLPILLFVLMGLIDFGRAYNAELQLSQAAREGARLAALGTFTSAQIQARVEQAAPALTGASLPAVVVTATCPGPGNAVVQVTSGFSWITGISAMSSFFGAATFPTPTTLSSTGVMQCALP